MNMLWRKLVSGVLAILMTLSLCPISALADAAEPDWSSAASAEAAGAGETDIYERDGVKSDPIGTAQMEKTIRLALMPEKSEEHVHEEVVVGEDGTETVEQHVDVVYPYHDWRAAVVISFDRQVAKNTIGLSTRCDNCGEGGVTGWHGFLISRDMAANAEIVLKGSFGSSLTYGKLCGQVRQILCGAFNLSDANVGTTMTVSLRLYEQNNGTETGSYYTLASYRHAFAKTIQVQYAQSAQEPVEDIPEESVGSSSTTVDEQTAEAKEIFDDQVHADTESSDEQTSVDTENNDEQTPPDVEDADDQTPTAAENNDDQTPTDTENNGEQTSTDVENVDDQTSIDVENNDEQTPQDQEGTDDQSPADVEGADELTPVDVQGVDGQTPADTKSNDDPEEKDADAENSDIKKDDLADTDLIDGEERSRGVEADVEPTDGGSETQWIVTLTSRTRESEKTVCRLSGGGSYTEGDSVTVTAYPRKGYRFIGWYNKDDLSFETILSNQQSYTFTISQDMDLVALFETTQGTLFQLTVHGSMYVVNNGGVQRNMSQYTYNAGEMMYISFCDSTKEFLYWVNSSGNILSTQKDFSFALASDTEISSYYAASDTADTSAMVIFRNAFRQVIQNRTYSVGQAISYPQDKPSKMGYIFKGWYIADENGEPTATEATEAAIYAAMEGNNAIIVVPDYVANGEQYTVTVSYVDMEGNPLKDSVSAVMGAGDSKTFVAPSISEYTFQYWTLNGKKASYSKSFTVIFAVSGEASLQAVYSIGESTQEPTIIITQTYSEHGEASEKPYIVANTLQYYAPEEYVVMEVGFVWSKNAELYGIAGGAANLKLDAPNANRHRSRYTVNEGIYTLNLKTVNPDNIYFVKAYMILKALDGSIVTLYSDMTAGSFNNLQNNELTMIVSNSSTSVLNATADVPSTTSIEDGVRVNNVAMLTIFVENEESGVQFNEESEAAKGYNIHIEGVKADNTELLTINMKKALPSGIQAETVKAYHEGTAMTSVASKAELTAEDMFFYDAATGDISIAVKHFSNYTFVYPVYMIRFVNEDGALLQYGTLLYSEVPTFAGNTPTKEADAGNTYTFTGWKDTNGDVYTAELPPATESMTYTAVFAANVISYTVKFVNYDGTELQSSEVAYGTKPAYEGTTPAKDATEDYTYEFDGWDPEITEVTGEATYTAKFKEIPRQFGAPVWNWTGDDENGYTSATATFTDANDPTVSKTVTDNAITIETTLATCTAAGATAYTATVTFNGTEHTDTKAVVIPALGHDWGEWTQTTASTCTGAGVETRTCSRCGETETRAVDALGHTPAAAVEEKRVEPTCMTAGSYDEVVYCSECHAELSRTAKTIPALGHDLVHHEAKAATCTAIGWEAYDTCSRCDYTTYVEIPALGHDLVHHDAQAATCTAIGWEAYDTCSRCDYTTYVEIPALGHNLTAHAAVAAGCETAGNSAYWSCSRCGKYFSDAEGINEISANSWVINALGHSWGEPAWSWTDTTSATATFTCTRDSSHTHTEEASITSAEGTGDDLGYTVYTATVSFNGNTYTDETRTLIEYSITYNGLDDATLEADNPTSYTVESDEITLNNPSKPHYEFAGWTGDGLDTPTLVVTIPAGSTGDRTYTATWMALTEYYLVGTIDGENLWDTIVDEYLFILNPDAEEGVEEYILNITLHEGDSFKVRRVTGGVLGTYTNDWFPQSDNYSVDAAHSGNVTVLFRPNGDGHSDWYFNVLYIPEQAAPESKFKVTSNFANVDTYLYRVGNGNEVQLGWLFEKNGDDVTIDSANVEVTVYAADDNTSVSAAFGAKALTTLANYSYTANSSDWTKSKIRFSGEGPVQVRIKEGANGTECLLNLEVVNANNATTATSATSANIVLLNDVSSGGLSISGKHTLYGNGFSVMDTRTNTSGSSAWITITNGIADNVHFLGQYFPTAVTEGTENQYYQETVRLYGKSALRNCVITGSRYAIHAFSGECIIDGSTIIGGAVGNMKIGAADKVVLRNVTTIQKGKSDNTPYGIGIHSGNDTTLIVLEGYLHQYNWAQKNQIPNSYSAVFSDLYTNSAYSSIRYVDGDATYINTGILFFDENNALTGNNLVDNRDASEKNSLPYTSITKTVMGKSGKLYTVQGSVLNNSTLTTNDDPQTSQYTIEPTYSFAYPNDSTNERHYCTYNIDTNTINIGYEKELTTGYTFNPNILTVTKFGKSLDVTIKLDGNTITGNQVFNQEGDHVLIYSYTDPYNYDKDTQQYISKTYTHEVNVNVVAVAPNAKNAEFIFYGYGSISKTPSQTFNITKTVTTSAGKTYIMPDATAGTYLKSTTIDGITVLCPVVYVDFKDNSSDFNWLYPLFLGVDIKDYADGGTATNATAIVTHNTQSAKPNGLTIITGNDVWSGGSGQSDQQEGKLTSGTYDGLYGYKGAAIGSNKSESTIYGVFSYKDNKGDTFYFVIAFYRAAHTCPSGCFAAGTMITLANGAQKAVENLTASDRILSWDFFTGEHVAQDISILVDHGENEYRVTNMTFSDGTVLRTIADHGLFDVDQNKFVYIVPENYESFIGHRFVKQKLDGGYDVVELVDVIITTETTHAYSITAAYTSNAFAAGVLTVAPPEKFYNWIEMGDTLRYDTAWFASMLEQYGTYDYSVFADYVTEKQFDQWNGKYLKIAVDSGKITFEEIIELIDLYKEFMPE